MGVRCDGGPITAVRLCRGGAARASFSWSRIQKHPVRAKRRQVPRAPFSFRTRFARFIRAPS
ncbi:hypothetical protein AURDEDRAFT_114117 [Auricularia subglabra TFB-10046 SS5]|nr:hypothetical protein AURDEDRAFT_114117 [Auricularia subglabra TFB-10046 SS5]